MVNRNASQQAIHDARLRESARVAAGIPEPGCNYPPTPAAREIARNHLRSHGYEPPASAEEGGSA